jgi:hypothetical protein
MALFYPLPSYGQAHGYDAAVFLDRARMTRRMGFEEGQADQFDATTFGDHIF